MKDTLLFQAKGLRGGQGLPGQPVECIQNIPIPCPSAVEPLWSISFSCSSNEKEGSTLKKKISNEIFIELESFLRW